MFLINFLIGIIFYSFLISNDLKNGYDALWHETSFVAGNWEISIGRWFWPLIDTIRFGFAANPLVSYITIAVIAFGNTLLADIFGQVGRKQAWLYGALFMICPAITSVLSYTFTSPTFAFSYLFSVGSIWLLNQKWNRYIRWAAATLLLCFSLGSYQSYLSCAVELILIYTIVKLSKEDFKPVEGIAYLMQGAVIVICACFLYKIIWDLVMKARGIVPANYKGADSLSVIAMIKSLPSSIIKACIYFRDFFLGRLMGYSNYFQGQKHLDYLWIVLLFIPFLCIGGRLLALLFRKQYVSVILCMGCFLLLPIGCNFTTLIVPEFPMVQMTVPFAFLLPAVFMGVSAIYEKPQEASTRSTKMLQKSVIPLAVITASAMLYGNLLQTETDIRVMYEGKAATESLMTQVVNKLRTEGALQEDQEYALMGRPYKNALFYKSPLWQRANPYARFGEWWHEELMNWSYAGVFRSMGIQVRFVSDAVYSDLLINEAVGEMPDFPADGSISEVDGVIVVKISDAY